MRRIMTHFLKVLGSLLIIGWWVGERGHLLLPSTRQVMRAYGWRRILSGEGPHAYVYGRWTSLYIGNAIRYVFPTIHAQHGGRHWADHYHSKVLTTEQASALLTVNVPIPRQDLEQIIPYTTAREIVLNSPPDIAVMECPCRANRDHPCTPTQVCMIVGQPFVDFVVEHQPDTTRRLTQAEALTLLREEHERGHLHAAYFKDVMLNRFYAICNCCGCCCGGIEAMVRYGVPMIASSGYVAQVDADECIACGTCAEVCPFEAVTVNGVSEIEWEKCMGCGVCVGQCTTEAMTLVRDARKGEPLDVSQLATAF